MDKIISPQPLVSIIMNCYNGESYLKESLNSILIQTYKNWELIFWDNKSKDKSSEVFKSYNDPRFKYYYAEEHTTLYKARNLAAAKAKGDFIAFLDTDDLWEKNKLELQIHEFKSSKIGVVFSNCWILKKNKTKKIYINKKLPSGNIFNELINNYNVGILTAVIRKDLFLSLTKRFDDRFTIIGDYDLFLRLSKICLFQAIQEPIATYRLHDKNFSNLNKEKEIEEIEIWLKENSLNLSEKDIQKLKNKNDNSRFLNYKIDGKYKNCVNMLLDPKKKILSIKNLLLLIAPSILLKKVLWFY
jgi:glycosyltransferase involved in cell wall biosynthesis